MAPSKRNANPSGLGRAIINRKAKDIQHAQESGFYTTDVDSTTRLKSITQERDLDAFLSTATLAETDFTAERRNVKVVNTAASASYNPFLLSDEEEKKTLEKFRENKQRLRVPRRPPWTKDMDSSQLDRQEKHAFLEWRRGLANLQDRDKFLLTPFERNLEVWRQLWRVAERSHLIVQIVDARNPLRFRCEDLEDYVKTIEGGTGEQGSGPGMRKNLLLINKADLLTAKQRRLWAEYFDTQGVQYAFFSAINAAALQQARRDALLADQVREHESGDSGSSFSEDSGSETSESSDTRHSDTFLAHEGPTDDENLEANALDFDGNRRPPSSHASPEDSSDSESLYVTKEDDTPDSRDPRAKVLSVLELEALFLKCAPDFSSIAGQPNTLTVGLVGYPNVGKSSTINALIGEKKVSVSSTPGKTKHFQTIYLSPDVMLCDCPGLVFPQFATTKADLVCDGVLPIDQLREHTGPTALVVKRIPKDVLEATYGLTIATKSKEEGGDGILRSENLLVPYAIARGFTRSGQGNPDEARAARYILKDYVNAKLLYCHPPPGVDEDDFNQETRRLSLLRSAGKKRAPVTRVTKDADSFVPPAPTSRDIHDSVPTTSPVGTKSQSLDQDFFKRSHALSPNAFVQGTARDGKEFSRTRLYPHQNAVADDGTPLSGRRARIASVLASAGADGAVAGKKHHKKPKRAKQRSGKGYDD